MTSDDHIENRAQQHRYELTQGGKLAARIDYKMRGDGVLDLVHTEVEPGHEGQGLGGKIAKFALDDAKARGLKVVPTCSYIAGYIEKHPEYRELQAAA